MIFPLLLFVGLSFVLSSISLHLISTIQATNANQIIVDLCNNIKSSPQRMAIALPRPIPYALRPPLHQLRKGLLRGVHILVQPLQ